MSSHRKTARDLHAEHEDARNEAVIRTRLTAEHEAAVRARQVQRIVDVLVQRPEPHHFHDAIVRPVSVRRGWDWPDQPGGPSSDFQGAIA